MKDIADIESSWNEIDAMRKSSYLNLVIEKARQDFANGDTVDEDELFDSLKQ